MAYEIHYGPVKWKKARPKSRKWKAAAVVIGFLAALFCGVHWRAELYEWLIPGDPAVTAGALENFAENLETGQGFKDAFACFCREILDGAQ